ncbi:MAG: flagellar protein export ATPase FliI [Ignavibacteriaceae bacterium]|nr:flagellar protein export ATPase FliI [Ignavibacterium sp.]MCC6253442.1 flagellar protein export ATPase FliI [Ignavibacteriaceae bacterium]HRN26996.1 flagellar protein export ATPase FliI [Ignavibacteriaceae bacterium]HRP91988.1 flagellar protein export ATPase FliI [Ignavibacteriaceae bacterium]HRQ54606.1 flagellar protein export ATPase FliI [Ignavibacteriaceae bacterium]
MDLKHQYIDKYLSSINNIDLIKLNGKVTDVIGLVIVSVGPNVSLGEVCTIINKAGQEVCKCEVVGFRDGKVLSIALGEVHEISPKCEIIAGGKMFTIGVGKELLGRVIDGLGNPIDGKGEIKVSSFRSLHREPPNPLERKRINSVLQTGVRAIDGLLTVGRGQRVGIFAGSGVGKSVTLGMIARNTDADVNVITLIGERGREVREFIEKDLGEDGLKKSVVVVATSDKSALVRIKGAYIGTTIAEYFRDLGMDVLLMMDSVTRFAMAQREIGLTIGEPPTTKGYTPSVFAALPKLLERAGTTDSGSITGLYNVLVDGDDMTEPIADAVRSILDGHIVLSRKLANSGQFPAVDPLQSVSRVMPDIVTKQHRDRTIIFNEILSTYREAEDLINIGAYVKGSNPQIDHALNKISHLRSFLKQDIFESSEYNSTLDRLNEIIEL